MQRVPAELREDLHGGVGSPDLGSLRLHRDGLRILLEDFGGGEDEARHKLACARGDGVDDWCW